MAKKTWRWHNNDTNELVAENQQDAWDTSSPRCPLCGEPSIYDEGQIDQDFMGNDLYGWWFACFGCNISTPAVEGNYNYE